MNIKIKKLNSKAKIPQYATDGAACFDLHAIVPEGYKVVTDSSPKVFYTGLAFEIPQGHVMLVFSRSGHGFKNGVRLANCTGIIDSDYRGEVQVKLTADEQHVLTVNDGERIAQAMIVPVDRVGFEEVETLSETNRGTGGFGSTGAQ